MNVTEAIRERRSIRSWQARAIEKDKLERVLEAGRLAPSASNRQPWKFIVVTDPAMRQQLVSACNDQKFVGEAPVVLVGCATETDRVMRCGQHCYPIDLSIAMTGMSLVAVEEGLGTCWVGSFYEDKVKKLLGIPEEVRVVEVMPLGYPASQPAAKPRKSLTDFAVFERWA